MSEKVKKPIWKRWWLWVVVVIVIIAAVESSGGSNNESSTAQQDTSSPEQTVNAETQPQKEEPKSEKKVTKEMYDKIETGMTYEEVVKIIGFEGEEMSSNEIAGIKTVMYQWVNPDGSNMNAMFQNGKLNSKAQFGLE